ncbi:LOW QUALITY PROTEIN: sulfate transporter, CysZ-type [Vibrio sp. JCM 18904]|nr:LOW QUALITY PROTEIN: sulfate transporter, CysZ-type [Vibrio sp. JCM 18904]
MKKNNQQRTGFGYFLYGIQLALAPKIRRFVILPLLANILLVGGAIFYLFSNLNIWIEGWIGQLPEFLSWLTYILWPLLALTILATFSYFSARSRTLSPRHSMLLAEKVEEYLTGQKVNDDGFTAVLKDVPRVLAREWRKLLYILPKAIGLFLLLLIPALGQTVGPFLWFIFTAWMLAIQYCDYPFDNHKIPFNDMRYKLKQKQGKAYGFGGVLVSVFTTIPILNLIVMPVAICGATAMWVAEFKHQR